jgi:folate-dependent phosphoribosylglycinamide formyltransferase PurN
VRAVLLSYESHQSCAIVDAVLERGLVEPVGFVASSVIDPRRRGVGLIRFLLHPRRVRFVCWKGAEVLISRATRTVHALTGRPAPSMRRLAASRAVPFQTCSDTADRAFVDFLRSCRADLLVSVHFNHVLTPAVWETTRLGAINVHGSLLPRHRGLFPHFYALAAGDDLGGVTVHWVNERLDDGAPIATRAIPITASTTVLGLENQAIAASVDALAEALAAIGVHGRAAALAEPPSTGPSRYHSWPTPEDLRRLRSSGHRYLCWTDIRDLIRNPATPRCRP